MAVFVAGSVYVSLAVSVAVPVSVSVFVSVSVAVVVAVSHAAHRYLGLLLSSLFVGNAKGRKLKMLRNMLPHSGASGKWGKCGGCKLYREMENGATRGCIFTCE